MDEYTVTQAGVFITRDNVRGVARTYRVLCKHDTVPATHVVKTAAGVTPLCDECGHFI